MNLDSLKMYLETHLKGFLKTENMNELNYIKFRTFWSKYSIKRQEKNQSICQEKVSVTPVIDTGMVTRRYKEFLQKKNGPTTH